MKRNILIVGFVILLFFTGCISQFQGESDEYESYGGSGSDESVAYEAYSTDYYANGEGYSESGDYSKADVLYESSGSLNEATGSLKTKKGSIVIKVETGELEDKLNQAKGIIADKNGEIVSISYDEYSYYEYSGEKVYWIEFKILPEDFEETLAELKELGDVEDINIDIEDVTEEYTDLEIRINNKELELGRLYELYSISGTVEELLLVEKEITRVTTELEQLKGQKQVLEDQIAKSKITLQIFEESSVSEKLEGQLVLNVGSDQLDSKLENLKLIVNEAGGTVDGLEFSENNQEKSYFVTAKVDPEDLEEFIAEAKELGEVKYIDLSMNEEDRPEKSLVYLTLVEKKSAIQTNFLVPLETLFNTFFAAFSTAILVLSGLLGFAIPIAIAVFLMYKGYRKLRPKEKVSKNKK